MPPFLVRDQRLRCFRVLELFCAEGPDLFEKVPLPILIQTPGVDTQRQLFWVGVPFISCENQGYLCCVNVMLGKHCVRGSGGESEVMVLLNTHDLPKVRSQKRCLVSRGDHLTVFPVDHLGLRCRQQTFPHHRRSLLCFSLKCT